MLYILLIIIAIGVLLISEPGKGILRFFGFIAVMGGIVGLIFGLISGSVFLVISNLEAIKTIVLGVLFIAIMLSIYVFILVVLPTQINKIFKNEDTKEIFWTSFFIVLLGLFIWAVSMPYL